MKAMIKMPDFAALAEKYQTAAADLDAAAEECVDKAADHMLERFKARLEAHKRSGDALNSMQRKPIVREGNRVSIDIGTFYVKEHRQGFMHALYQEFGSPTFKKDPWLRPEVDAAGPDLKKIYRAVFERYGYGGMKDG